MSKKGGSSGNQTVTQKNLPDWAIPFVQNTMNIGSQFTMNPNYRPSTLDQDYSGIRGYNAQGQTNSQVGQFGLNPSPSQPGQVSLPENLQTSKVLEEQPQLLENPVVATPPSGTPVYVGYGRDYDPTKIYTDLELNAMAQSPTGEFNDSVYRQLVASQTALKNAQQAASSQGTDGTQDGEEEDAVPFSDMLTPFQTYDRQRFAAPNANTLTGERLMAGRYADRFGADGTDTNPYSSAINAANRAASYTSGYSPASLNITGPTANSYSNLNSALTADTYSNANSGLTGAQDYSRDFAENLSQYQDPYTSQVVDQTISDLDRARRITDMDISSNAARRGSYGGSREALMRSENARNFADRTAAAVGQLRSQGFQQAADRAAQEQMQRLGLTAQDTQNVRGYQSAANLQGQGLTAQDARDVRNLISQGGLASQSLSAQSDRDAMNYANQLKMQGNQLNVEQARLAEQFRQGAGALNLQGAGALGNLQQMSIADERQRLADMLAAGAGQSGRDQQDLDFIYSEFNRELDYPGRQIDLRNAAISPATGSIVQTTQPRYQSNPLLGAAGAGLSAYGITKNPYAAGGAALLSLLYS